jgi:diaminopimelate decarboxylase
MHSKTVNLTPEQLNQISSDFGESFYILDGTEFETRFKDLLGQFKKYYPKTIIAYSYKTNYIPRLCEIVNELGGFAEVVSSMECDLARKVGVTPKDIYFNGPYKTFQAIEDLLLDGGVVNADSDTDLAKIVKVAQTHSYKTIRVGIRCNFDIGDGVVSRFGFNSDNGDLNQALDRLFGVSNITVEGLHCHFASRSLGAWEKATSGMLRLVSDFHSKFNCWPKSVSLGGGLYGPMDPALTEQLNITPPSFAEYALTAAGSFERFFKDYSSEDKPFLIIEPGTALAANALKFVAKVINIKNVGLKDIATVAGSHFNTNPTSSSINLPMSVVSMPETPNSREFADLDIAGYTCIESDYLFRGYTGKLSVGDFVIFDSAGSYSVVMKPPFILPQVPIVEIGEDNQIQVVKRQETFEDIFQSYQLKTK